MKNKTVVITLDAGALNNVSFARGEQKQNKSKENLQPPLTTDPETCFFLKVELIVAGVYTLALFNKADIK